MHEGDHVLTMLISVRLKNIEDTERAKRKYMDEEAVGDNVYMCYRTNSLHVYFFRQRGKSQ